MLKEKYVRIDQKILDKVKEKYEFKTEAEAVRFALFQAANRGE